MVLGVPIFELGCKEGKNYNSDRTFSGEATQPFFHLSFKSKPSFGMASSSDEN